MPKPICIITSTGVMICEQQSYYRHYYTTENRPTGVKISKDPRPSGMKERVNKLMDLANVQDAPFTIIPRPKARRSKR